MPSTIIDSAIFGDIFSSEPMRNVWSDENRTQKYLDIEGALARVQGRLGIIPKEAADEIVRHCTIDRIDMQKLKQQTERIGYPVLGVISQLTALCRDTLGEYCHWGATTQDITDTATLVQIRVAHDSRRHRRGRMFSRPSRRNARQVRNGREADDADGGRRGLRAVRAGSRLEQHDAAKAQSDLVVLHPRGDLGGSAAHGGAA